jgi:ADP-heptose:LPS heptosyltransferase
VEEYVDLLQQYVNETLPVPSVTLLPGEGKRRDAVMININSEASSRRLPVPKAVSIISAIRGKIQEEIILIGSPKEKDFVDEVYRLLKDKNNITNMAGATTLPQLVEMMSACKVMLTTDSGPAHLANAAGIYTIVLFGAGNEQNTAPYNKKNNSVIRLGELGCEPCTRNVCKLYDEPKCLTLLDEQYIAATVQTTLK